MQINRIMLPLLTISSWKQCRDYLDKWSRLFVRTRKALLSWHTGPDLQHCHQSLDKASTSWCHLDLHTIYIYSSPILQYWVVIYNWIVVLYVILLGCNTPSLCAIMLGYHKRSLCIIIPCCHMNILRVIMLGYHICRLCIDFIDAA